MTDEVAVPWRLEPTTTELLANLRTASLKTRIEERLGIPAWSITGITAESDPMRGMLVTITTEGQPDPHIHRWDVHRLTVSVGEWSYLNSGKQRPEQVEASAIWTDSLNEPSW